MEQQNPYAAPQVALVDEPPLRELPGWSAKHLRLLGWTNLATLLGTLLMLVLTFFPDVYNEQLDTWFSASMVLLGCYVLLRFKGFAEQRFAARGLAWPIGLSVLLSLLLEGLQILWGAERMAELSSQSIGYFGLLALYGVITLWLGIRLLKVENVYPSFRILAWLDIAGGGMMATVILLLLGILPLLASMLAMTLVFWQGARELEAGQQP